ncbi:MAG: maleylpyruvate isomerase N-terminal domain-containing protein [Acidimicrobiales bacterium]
MEGSEPRLVTLPHGGRVRVLRHEIDRLNARLSDLDPGRLDLPAIGDWTVREVVAHLAVVAEFYTDGIVRGAAGEAGAAGDRPPAGTGRGELAAAGIRRAAAVAGADDDVIGRFRRAGLGLVDVLDSDGVGLDYDCYHPGGIVAANRFLVLYLKELGLHEWDIFQALEPPCSMSRWGVDAALQAMEEELASGSLRWLTDPGRSPDTATIRVTTRGSVAIERDLVLEPDQTRLTAVDTGRSVDGGLSLEAADLALGCSGRIDLVAVIADKRGDGDVDGATMLSRRLTGM